MQRLQIRLTIIISILLALLLIFDATFFYGMTITPNQLKVNYQTLKSELIPENMTDKTIVYFTDLQYGQFENKERTKKVFNQIKELNPDILIFGGDLFDTDTKLTKKNIEFIQSCLSSVEAPLGKYAVWGEKDTLDETRKSEISTLYKNAQVEVLDNSHVSLANQSKNGIRLIGFSNKKGVKSATENISNKTYNLLVTHQPDNLTSEKLASSSISYAMAGHAHATQITYPLLGPYRKEKGSTDLNLSNREDLSFPYLLSTGVGCTHVNVRYNAKPEIHYFILKTKK